MIYYLGKLRSETNQLREQPRDSSHAPGMAARKQFPFSSTSNRHSASRQNTVINMANNSAFWTTAYGQERHLEPNVFAVQLRAAQRTVRRNGLLDTSRHKVADYHSDQDGDD